MYRLHLLTRWVTPSESNLVLKIVCENVDLSNVDFKPSRVGDDFHFGYATQGIFETALGRFLISSPLCILFHAIV